MADDTEGQPDVSGASEMAAPDVEPTGTPSVESPTAVESEKAESVQDVKSEDNSQPVEATHTGGNEPLFDMEKLNILNDVTVVLTIEIGRAHIKIRDILSLTKGSIVELDKLSGEPVDVYANGKLISTGSIITVNGKYCVRLTSINEKNKVGETADGK